MKLKQAARQTLSSQHLKFPLGFEGHDTEANSKPAVPFDGAQRVTASVSSNDG